jgi:L-malate glycosyltransferase
MMRKVVVAQHRLVHYRTAFFERLRVESSSKGIDLHLVHGQPTRRERQKADVGRLPWADVVSNRYVEVGQRDWVWQPMPRHLRDADLVVLMQENRLLSNYPRLFGLSGRSSRLAFWGHGRNFQADAPHGLRERWKRSYIGRVDWWFAYTSMTRDALLADRYPEDRITVLDNAIDNEGFARDLAAVTAAQLDQTRRQLELGSDEPLGLFCGSLYPDKRLEFLIAAGDLIQRARPGFRLAVIGEGPSAAQLREAAATRRWLKPVGAKRGLDKAVYFRLANVVLNPGLVGLHVLDAFCAGLPMITTSDAKHSPEIAYLKGGVNGLICPGDVDAYASHVIELLGNSLQFQAMSNAALVDSRHYTLDRMVRQFVEGMTRCLSRPKKSEDGR